MALIQEKYQKKTVLQVIPSLACGGVERGTVEIARRLKEEGHIPLVASAGGMLVNNLTARGIVHINLNAASKNPFVIWKNARVIAKIVEKYGVDIIHARSRAPAWSCYMAARASNTKFLTTFHGIYDLSNSLKKYYNSIMLKGEKVIAVSNYVKHYILENYAIDPEKIIVINRGVDYQYFDHNKIELHALERFKEEYNIPANMPIILLPSRLTEWKGQLFLIEALNKIKHLNFYCLLVGDLSKHPNFTIRIREKIAKLRLQGKVQIFSSVTDMLSLYGISSLVLSTSIRPEAFGRTIIEGQAMEKLVIATNIGGAAETVIDKSTGFHVTPGDVDGLADKIAYCLSILGTAEADLITHRARKSVIDNFSLNLMLSQTMKIYQDL